MPLYDYKCAAHGLFHELVPLRESGDVHACPTCGTLSPRVLMVAPQLLMMDATKRNAFARNEKAAHEPRHGNQHSEHESGCCHRERHKPQVFYTAEGNKMFPSARPWMISH